MTGPLDDPFAGLPTREDVQALTLELARQDRRGKWNRRLIYVLAVIAAALLVLGLFAWRSSAYAVCNSDRSKALSGPGADRVNFFLQAYNEAAGAIHTPLTKQQRAGIIAGLDRDRAEFSVLPKHAGLVKRHDSELLALRDLVKSLHANKKYNAAAKHHPVCSLWGI